MNDPQMTVDEILAALEPYTGDYPRAALDAALAQREAIVPRLIDILHQAAQDPDVAAESQLSFYALFLLGHFGATQAHQTLLDLAALPCGPLEGILGDGIWHLPMALYRTCGGQAEGLKALALNPDACEWSVSAALQALSYLVVDGVFPRSEMIDLLKPLLDPSRAAELQEMTPTLAADTAYSLHPAELMAEIEAVFAAEVIDEMYISLDSIRERNQESLDDAYERLRQDMERHSLDDLHDTLSDWAMYGKYDVSLPSLAYLDAEPGQYERPLKTYDNAKRKKKRKIAKASRKKNRGR